MSCVEDGLDHNCSPFTFGGSVDDCHIPLIYKEDVDGPIPGAPGCNPNTTVDPAPLLEPCPLGTYGGPGTLVPSSTHPATSSSLDSTRTIPTVSPIDYSSTSATEAPATTTISSASSSTLASEDPSSVSTSAAVTLTTSIGEGQVGLYTHTHTHWVHTVVTKYVEARAEPTRRAVRFAA